MSKKINAAELRKLVLETIQEVNGSSSRKEEFASIVENAKRLVEDADPSKVDSDRFPLKLSDAAAKAGEEAEMLATGGDDDGADADRADCATRAVMLAIADANGTDADFRANRTRRLRRC